MATIVSKGLAVEILNLTLSSTDDIQIGFTQPVNSCFIKCRTSVDIQVRTSRGAGNYYTIPSGQSLQLDLRGVEKDGAVSPLNVWLRSTSSTPVAEVLGIYGG